MTDNLTQITLSNGLRVLLKEIHTAPLISSWTWYRVGARDEVKGLTGISHWVEHMQFKGTPQFPANLLEKAIARDGGVWNAFTHLDWTTYFETMPADRVDLALRLEADRMVNSIYDLEEVASERTVIISEREGNENEPHFLLGEAVQGAAFRVHAYHHEVIGEMADLQAITRDDLFSHYKTYYVPNNAVLAIAGDFDTDEMLVRIKELYEPISKGEDPNRIGQPEPPQEGEIRLSVEGPGETTYVQVCYHFPPATHPDFYPLSVLNSLFAGPSGLNMFGGGISNKTSRLYRAMVDKEWVVGVRGSAQATIDPFLYTVAFTIHPDRQADEALSVLDDEIKRVQDEIISEDEVRRAIKQARALFAYGSENISNQAFWMGYSEMFADYTWFENYLDNLSAVTPASVQRVAREYLRPESRVVGTYVPKDTREVQDA
jgi:zinc protease